MFPGLSLQQLSPSNAKLCIQVKNFWNQFPVLSENKTELKILLALSGGADSTAMASILHLLQTQLNIKLSAVTINHQIRKEAHRDTVFVEHLCENLNIKLFSHKAEVIKYSKNNKIGIEEAGRILRYKILEEIRLQVGANYIAIAHNADDLCEDVLMRMTRGTAWPGLGGMQAVDIQRKLIRPLITIKREQIEDFLYSIGQQWQSDGTNQDITYTRNRFRHNIVPLFHKENPKFHKAINNLWSMANLDAQFWDEYLNDALKKEPWRQKKDQKTDEISLSNGLLTSLPKVARLRMIAKAIKEVQAQKNNIRSDILFNIERSWASGKGGKIFYLNTRLCVRVKQRSISIQHLK